MCRRGQGKMRLDCKSGHGLGFFVYSALKVVLFRYYRLSDLLKKANAAENKSVVHLQRFCAAKTIQFIW